jgi:hypothetical protein
MRAAILSMAVGLAACVDIDTEGLPDTGLDTSDWTTGDLPPIDDIVNLHDIQIAAKNTLSGKNYAYYRTAALDEITYNRNLFDWQKIRLNGFSFADVSNINLKTTILGYEFEAPFFIAPAAKAGKASDGAESNLVQAAGAAGILYIPSISSTLSIEEIASASTNASQRDVDYEKPMGFRERLRSLSRSARARTRSKSRPRRRSESVESVERDHYR